MWPVDAVDRNLTKSLYGNKALEKYTPPYIEIKIKLLEQPQTS